MKFLKIFTNQYFWLGLILILGFGVRLYKINSPIADWHSWRQADTAAVTRNFIKYGFNPFLPRYDDMSGVAENPIPNPDRLRFVEFPIYNIVVYPFYLFFGVSEFYSRLVSVFFSLGAIIFLYLITKKYINIITAEVAAFAFTFLPFSVFFSRTTLPEGTFIFFSLGLVYFVDRWIWEHAGSKKNVWGIIGFIFTMLAFLIKPWAIFFIPPLIYSISQKEHKIIPPIKYLLLFFLAVVPFIVWRFWILQQPEGIPASNWLLNGDGIRFRPAFFWWIISERMGREILGATGFVLFIIGLIFRPKNGNYFLHYWALSMFSYLIIFATGNVRHNYYQYIFVPVASVFFAKGTLDLITGIKSFVPRFWTILLAILFFPLAFYFSFLQVKGFYQINNPVIVDAGKKADSVLPKDAIVVAPYNGDTAFLYQTNRPGWAVIPTSVKDLIADYGVTSYISTTYDSETAWVLRHFYTLEKNPQFVIADLTRVKTGFSDTDPEPK